MQSRLLKIISGLIFISVVVISIIFYVTKSSPPLISLFPLQNYDQHINNWIKVTDPNYDKQLLTSTQQKNFVEELYRHYFSSDVDALSPWNPAYINRIFSMKQPVDIYSFEQKIVNTYDNKNNIQENKIGYGANFHPYSDTWIEGIKRNINLEQFNKKLVYDPLNRGIVIDNLSVRLLPTEEAHFYSHQLAGQGYPFDNLQASIVWAGTPVYVIAETRDHAWDMVLTPDYYIAWIKSAGIARADDAFIKIWQDKARHQLVGITHTQIPILDTENSLYRFAGFVGMLFPMEDKGANAIRILIPVADEKRQAHIHHAILSMQQAGLVPLLPTMHIFVEVMSQLINRPYGWGGMYFYNDCSAELKSIYNLFGIWLPRHSTYQVDQEKIFGSSVDISTSSDQDQRIAYLKKHGHPFMTIVYIGGHVFMYLGAYPNPIDPMHMPIVLTYQNLWGLSPTPANRRVIIGQSVLLPLLNHYPEAPELNSLAAHKFFKLIYLDQLPMDIQKFRTFEFNNIDMSALMEP